MQYTKFILLLLCLLCFKAGNAQINEDEDKLQLMFMILDESASGEYNLPEDFAIGYYEEKEFIPVLTDIGLISKAFMVPKVAEFKIYLRQNEVIQPLDPVGMNSIDRAALVLMLPARGKSPYRSFPLSLDDLPDAPGYGVVLNLSPHPLAIQFNEEKELVQPGKFLVSSFENVKNYQVQLRMFYQDPEKGSWRPVYSKDVVVDPNSSGVFLSYKSLKNGKWRIARFAL